VNSRVGVTEGRIMRRSSWGKAMLAAVGIGIAVAGASRAQAPAVGDPAQVVVIREPGKPEQRCVIEFVLSQSDGKSMYYVRDIATGERMRVVDGRPNKMAGGPIVGRVVSRLDTPTDRGMTSALASSPLRVAPSQRISTAAELAGTAPAASGTKPKLVSSSSKPKVQDQASPVELQIAQLKDGQGSTQREAAAMVLAVSEARTKPEVVKAIMTAARSDPAPSVRTTCVRCLYRLCGEVPDVVPVIADCRSDLNPEVSATAAKALEEIGKRK
jgi:hypothetical protein